MPFPAFFFLATALGAKEGIARRKEKKDLLDLEAERLDTINNTTIGLDAAGIGNKFDARQMEAMREQFVNAKAWAASPDSKLQAAGLAALQNLSVAVRGNIQQNETEFRAEEVRQQEQEIAQTGLTKAANEKRFERGLVMNKQLNDDLQPFQESQLAFNKVMNLLDNNDQLSSLAGLTAFVQSIDDSIVKEAELVKYQGANGLITQLSNILAKTEGRDFTEATKQSVRNAVAALFNAQKTTATGIVASYQDRALAWELDVDNVLSGVDQSLFVPIPIDREAQLARQAEADAAESAFNLDSAQFKEVTGELVGLNIPGTSVRLSVNPADNIRKRLVQPFLDLAGTIGRGLRGAKIFRKDDGSLWIKERDGTINPVTNQDFLDLQAEAEAGIKLAPGIQERLDNPLRIEGTTPISRRP